MIADWKERQNRPKEKQTIHQGERQKGLIPGVDAKYELKSYTIQTMLTSKELPARNADESYPIMAAKHKEVSAKEVNVVGADSGERAAI